MDFTFSVLFFRIPIEEVSATGRKTSKVSRASKSSECEAIAWYPSVLSYWYVVRSETKSVSKLGLGKLWFWE